MNRKALAVLVIIGLAGMLLVQTFGQNAPTTAQSTTQPGRRGQARGRGRGRAAARIPFPEPADVALPRVDEDWSGQHMALINLAKTSDADLYLLGDSITDNWGHPPSYTPQWHKYFDGWKTANFGLSGDRTEHVLYRIENGELDHIKPKVIMLLIGTNNLPKLQYNYSQDTPEQTAAGVKQILDVIKQKQPQAKVLLVSVFPREDQPLADDMNGKVMALNALISKYADGQQVKYLDIYSKFLGPDGKLIPGTTIDNLHPTAAGYDIWGAAMMPILTEWLGPPAGH